MRHAYAILAASLALAACSGAKPIPSEDIRGRAQQAFSSLDREAGQGSDAADKDILPPARPVKPGVSAAAKTQAAAPASKPGEKTTAATDPEEPEVRVLEADPAKKCTWIESKASVVFGENDAKNQAEAQAASKAVAQAMHKFLGQELTHNFIDYQQEGLKNQVTLTESLLRVTQPGMEIDRKVLSSGPEDLPGCTACRYGVALRTCIASRKPTSDPNFRAELKLKRTRLMDGDEAEASMSVTQDAYVYLYDIDMQANATLLFPDQYVQDNFVKAGKELPFPTPEHRKIDAKLQASLPEGARVSAEVLRVIATKTPLPRSVLEGGARKPPSSQSTADAQGPGSFLGLMQRLNASGLEWAEDMQAFTIYKE